MSDPASPTTAPPLPWFDAHLDLAYLAETGRDMTRPTADLAGPVPAAITIPSLCDAHVETAIATIFVQPRITGQGPGTDVDGPWCYSSETEAHMASLRQLSLYLEWQREDRISFLGVEKQSPTTQPPASDVPTSPSSPPLRVILSLEGATAVRSTHDIATFNQCGVRIVALAWCDGNKWAGGDHSGEDVTPEGKILLDAIDDLLMIHDVSHLSEKAFWTVLKDTRRPKIASHSNCRALLPHASYPQRHLSDPQITALANAGGVIGINLYAPFLARDALHTGQRPTTADVVRHIQHITQLTGRDDCVGLGSDMEGGFSTLQLPLDLDHPRHLPRLAAALSAAGFSDEAIARFAHKNFQRVLSQALNVVL